MLAGIIGFIVRFRWLLMVGSIVSAIGGAYIKGYVDGGNRQEAIVIAKTAKKAQEAMEVHNAIEREVMRSDDDDLDKRLDKWMRN